MRIVRFNPYAWEKILESKNPDYKLHRYELFSTGTVIEAELTYAPLDKAASALVPEDVRLRRLKVARSGVWRDDDWRPYCYQCTTGVRMTKMPYGFKCECCKNDIGWDLLRLTDSDYKG